MPSAWALALSLSGPSELTVKELGYVRANLAFEDGRRVNAATTFSFYVQGADGEWSLMQSGRDESFAFRAPDLVPAGGEPVAIKAIASYSIDEDVEEEASDAAEGDAAEGDTAEGDAADGDTADGDTADGDTADGDTADVDLLTATLLTSTLLTATLLTAMLRRRCC